MERGCKIADERSLTSQRLGQFEQCATRERQGFHCRELGDLRN